MIKSVYIHIPFCTSICTYCDFPKIIKNESFIDKYLIELEKEIKLNYKNELIETIYIGGGTPTSLNLKQLEKLFKIIDIFKVQNPEITIEANSEDLNHPKLKFLKTKVNRLSIGVQTFDEKLLKKLGRRINEENLKNAINQFENTSIDLMYALENQTLNDLKKDIDEILKLKPKHISTYSLIIEPHTKLFIDKIENISEELDRKMYDYIKNTLKKNNYIHYETSNYAKKSYESKHNLTYWNNENYYGFGLGASGYIKNERYENTRSLTDYLNGKYKLISNKLTKNEIIQNEFIVGLRKIKGIDKENFKNKYKISITSINEVKKLLKEKLLIEDEKNIWINPKYTYTANEILIQFIDYEEVTNEKRI